MAIANWTSGTTLVRGPSGWSCRRPALGATLIELVCGIVLLVCVAWGAMAGRNAADGWWGYWVEGGLGALAWFLGMLVLAMLFSLWDGSGLPMCRNGCCRGPGVLRGHGDYRTARTGEESIDVCKCGDRYRLCGRRFLWVNSQGVATPYLVWRPFRGWRADTEKANTLLHSK